MPRYINDSLMNHIKESRIIIFSSNGSLKKDGSNVMGKGIGNSIFSMMPTIAKALGNMIKEGGNECYSFKIMNFVFISFPTKHNYWEDEDIELIRKSANKLKTSIDDFVKGDEKILMEYPLMSKEYRDDVVDALKDLDVDIFMS